MRDVSKRRLRKLVVPSVFIFFTTCALVWNSDARKLASPYTVFAVDTGLKYPIKDSETPVDNTSSPLDLKTPSNIERKVEYDPETRQYVITETIGGRFFRDPMYMSFEEYQRYELNRSKQDYWKERTGSSNLMQSKGIVPKLYVNNQVFDRIFGGSQVDIRPQGTAELIFSGRFQKNENPALNKRQQKTGSFEFDQKIQMNVIGNIGDKLRLTTNYNTESTFDWENQMKLEYTGYEDEIIKKIELGNVSLPIGGTLVSGSQSLFGIKTQLQFGRLTMTTVFSQQKSEKKELTFSSGAQTSEFKFSADNYEANKHYFLAQYFREQYNTALSRIPAIISGISISKIEVWVTNKNNTTTDTRDIIAFLDLGENEPFNTAQITGGTNPLPSSDTANSNVPSNNLLAILPAKVRESNDNSIDEFFKNNGGSNNYAKLTNARKLSEREFTFHPQLGYISLNSSLNSDEVLAVAYRYTYNGKEYTVGEFSTENPPSNPQKVLYTKLLKNVSVKTQLPTWDLMMKNIYSLNAFQISPKNFKLNILYLDEKTSTHINYLPDASDTIKTKPIIQLLNLDNLNSSGNTVPDGIFDFIDGITINATNGRVIFPLLEPFGENLGAGVYNVPEKYKFRELYDSTKYRAQQVPERNKFIITGSYQSSSGSEFSLNAINIPQGSVIVTAGTAVLKEGTDYTVDYNIGKVKIVNEGILNSGAPIKISLESNTLFNIQSKSLFGSRFDYKVNENLNLGGTVLKLTERPITQKVNIGDEPISNSMYGLDLNYRTDSRFLTSLVDYIPLIETKEMSTLTVSGEYAVMVPGHSRALNTGKNRRGVSYIDDFEGSKSIIDLRNPGTWSLSSTPALIQPDFNIFGLENGYHRARLAFYDIDDLFYSKSNNATPSHIKGDKTQLSNHYIRQILEDQVFPNKETPTGQPNILPTLDIAYYPRERGPYNFNVDELDADGRLMNPNKSWGGIMRRVETNDFEALNVEYLEFWLMDPFIYNPNSAGGDLYINLGDISEDILKDGRKSVENGLPSDGDPSRVDTTVWGLVPTIQPITNTFDNNPDSRKFQDVGLDGLNDDGERSFFDAAYLSAIKAKYGENSEAYKQAVNDPSADNYSYFLGQGLDNQQASILERYKRYNGVQGNSPTSEQSLEQTGISNTSATPNPDSEDINKDNTPSSINEYFQYRVPITPATLNETGEGSFITDKVTQPVKLANGQTENVTWYQFKVPIQKYEERVGGIEDFRSIRFVRAFLTNFSDTVIMRMARFQLVRGEWRKLEPSNVDGAIGFPNETGGIAFDVSTVSIEENANREPIPYKLPPGIDQERNQSDPRGNTHQNEQSLVLDVCHLPDGTQVMAYKNLGLDFRSYKRIEMFIHAEGEDLRNNDVNVFVRFGTDYDQNYYEYEIPMEVTPPGSTNPTTIWPESNKLDIPFSVLQLAKQARNNLKIPLNDLFPYTDGKNKIWVKGSPDLSNVRTVIIGVRNPLKEGNPNDDEANKCAQIWVNELRLKEFDEDGGWAATGRVNAKLADFSNVTVSGSRSTFGFGSIDKKVSERNKTDNTQYDVSSNVELGKFLPEKTGVNVPMYVSYSEATSKPQYAPNNPDILFSNVLSDMTAAERDSLRRIAEDFTVRKSINFTNVRKVKTKTGGKPHVYDVENLSATYAYTEEYKRNYTTQHYISKNYRGGLGYNFSTTPKHIRPFDKFIKSKHLKLIKDFNFAYTPSLLDFRIDVNRNFAETKLRNINVGSLPIPETFDKNFTLARIYAFKHDLTKALKVDFNASNMSTVDEPFGRIDTEQKKDSLKSNLYKFGRTTQYEQNFNLNYNVPINKLPLLDWTSLTARYGGKYSWIAAPPAVESFGNTISNSRNIQLNGQFTLSTLYNKSKYLKSLTPAKPGGSAQAVKNPLNKFDPKNPLNQADTAAKEETKENPAADIAKILARALISVKSISATYNQSNGITLPGYKPTTDIFGMNLKRNAPGAGFVFGSQEDIRPSAVQNGWLTTDTNLNNKYITSLKRDISLRASVEPLPDLKMEITGTRSYSEQNQEFFKYLTSTNSFTSLSPTTTGNFSISYNTFGTAFSGEDSKGFSDAFTKFENNRIEISRRLAANNPHAGGPDSTGFNAGYGKYSQDVLIPAFLAAYSDVNPANIELNSMPAIPKPNWRITYTGLTRIEFLQQYFSSISLNHSYRSTYSVNTFNKPLSYSPERNKKYSNGNFIPEFEISQISVSEQFAPLFGIDVTLKNEISANFEFKKSRSLGMSFNNYRLEQLKTNEFQVGIGYRTNDLKLPFSIAGSSIVLKNDVNFRLDFSIRDNKTISYQLDQNSPVITNGALSYSIKPSVDYVVNQRFNVKLFYDRTVNKPHISTPFPTAFTNFGVSVLFTLGG